MKITKKIGLLLLAIFIIAQFFGPDKNSGQLQSVAAFETETNPPEDVKRILRENCYDCHSDVTNYPWYNSITPLNYWLNHHIEEGKSHFNVSKWEGLSAKRKDHKFDELIEEVEEGEMPLESYTLVHRDAKLSEAQIKAMINWATLVRVSYGLAPKPE
jgi:hypothetical protein